MKEPKMTKEEREVYDFDDKVYALNREHIEKLDKIDFELPAPRFCQTDVTTPKHEIRVITYIMTRRKK